MVVSSLNLRELTLRHVRRRGEVCLRDALGLAELGEPHLDNFPNAVLRSALDS